MIQQLQQEARLALQTFAKAKKVDYENLPLVQVQIPPSGMKGHFTLVLFPFLPRLQAKPDELAAFLANHFIGKGIPIDAWEVVKGFFNVSLSPSYWLLQLDSMLQGPAGLSSRERNGTAVVVEFPSPNTNKPLHLGHLRNIFLGSSLARILEEVGFKVVRTNLYNDRGTNISKSMAAWLNSTDKISPDSSGIKGDHLVGIYYVRYSDDLKKQIKVIK